MYKYVYFIPRCRHMFVTWSCWPISHLVGCSQMLMHRLKQNKQGRVPFDNTVACGVLYHSNWYPSIFQLSAFGPCRWRSSQVINMHNSFSTPHTWSIHSLQDLLLRCYLLGRFAACMYHSSTSIFAFIAYMIGALCRLHRPFLWYARICFPFHKQIPFFLL